MKRGFQIWLRAGERIYVNGAVLRVDRKVSMEFLNDVTFLLENHVILQDQATTPLRQLYFIVQTMLIDPKGVAAAREMFETSLALLLATFENEQIRAGLASVRNLVGQNSLFEALKTIRALFVIEDGILSKDNNVGKGTREVASCR